MCSSRQLPHGYIVTYLLWVAQKHGISLGGPKSPNGFILSSRHGGVDYMGPKVIHFNLGEKIGCEGGGQRLLRILGFVIS